jgi:hypothetical protein
MFINSINDLITLPSHTWDSLSHHPNLGPIIIPIVKKEVELRKINFKQKKEKLKKTFAEILADVHKIKRYLYCKTELKKEKAHLEELYLKDLAFLNMDALEEGFNEQKSEGSFDAGPVLDEIKSYLQENYATPNLPKEVKPSNGMILVIIELL